jgi:hypothetical protein
MLARGHRRIRKERHGPGRRARAAHLATIQPYLHLISARHDRRTSTRTALIGLEVQVVLANLGSGPALDAVGRPPGHSQPSGATVLRSGWTRRCLAWRREDNLDRLREFLLDSGAE